LAVAGAGLLRSFRPAAAATTIYFGDLSGDYYSDYWYTAGNLSGSPNYLSAYPGANLVIASGGTANYTPANGGYLNIYTGSSDGASITVSNGELFGNNTQGGNAGGIILQNGGQLTVSGSGTVSLSSGLEIGGYAGDSASVVVSGGNLLVGQSAGADNELFVGHAGNGTLTQSGGNVTTPVLNIADEANTNGNLTITDGTLTVNNSAWVGGGSAGSGGTGSLNISNYATVNVTGGLTVYSGGTLNLSGGTLLTQGLNLANGSGTVNWTGGALSAGSVTQSGGTFSAAGDFTVDASAGNANSYSLAGGNLNVGGSEDIGNSGNGTFTQSAGNNSAGSVYLAYAAGTTGNYNLSGNGSLTVGGTQYVGYSGNGAFTQTGSSTTVSAANLSLGSQTGATGTYNLQGGSLSLSNNVTVSAAFTNATANLNISGGNLKVGNVLNVNVAGTVNQSNGSVSTGDLNIGAAGLEGSNVSLSYRFPNMSTIYNGPGASGTLTFQVGTSQEVTNWGGSQPGGGLNFNVSGDTILTTFSQTSQWTGTMFNGWTLSDAGDNLPAITGVSVDGSTSIPGFTAGDVSFDSTDIYVNWAGLTVSPSTQLLLDVTFAGQAANAPGVAAYNLSGNGSLTASGPEQIGYGTFTQSGGTNSTTSLYLGYNNGSTGNYILNGNGSLAITGGEFVGYFGNGTFIQSGGTNSAGTLYIGDLSGSNGSYSLSGNGSLAVNSAIYIGANGNATGTLNVSGGSLSAPAASLTLGNGSVTVSNTGLLTVGSLTQTGGLFTVSGGNATVVGNLSFTNVALSGGTLNVGSLSGSGMNWTAGTLNLTNSSLTIGSGGPLGGNLTLSNGQNLQVSNVYDLSIDGGALNETGNASVADTHVEYVGFSGNGAFNQTGGSNSAPNVDIGLYAGSAGSYALSGNGGLTVKAFEVVGQYGNGTFTQGGGTNSVGTLFLGGMAGSNGSYSLSGNGSLSAGTNEYVGYAGNGSFAQSAGTNSTPSLYLGYNPGANGNYVLSGNGSLAVTGAEYIGYSGNGTFNQGGGTNAISGGLCVGGNSSYALSAGTLAAGSMTVNSGGSLAWSGGTLNVMGPLSGAGLNSLTVPASGTLLGNTTVSAPVTVASGGTISPGGPAVQTFNAGLTLQSGGAFLCHFTSAGMASPSTNQNQGADWDEVAASSLSVTSGGNVSSFTIDLAGTLTNVASGAYDWTIAAIAGNTTITNQYSSNLLAGSGFLTAPFELNTSQFSINGVSDPNPNLFTLELVPLTGGGDDLVLGYNVTPEPGTATLVLSAAGPLLLARRRRRRLRPATAANGGREFGNLPGQEYRDGETGFRTEPI
jgi:hypothetical protein